ncbi:MAG TPA: HlyD family secretion protein [Caulobacteraceae bacterium]|jgi:membrane fusion protein (multidrug efflux system)|nr:HlyD family secretion protein [Caulobacteraceae bacterium]
MNGSASVSEAVKDVPPAGLRDSAEISLPRPGVTRRIRVLHWRRWALFLLLPIVLIASGIWYVNGGQTVSLDDAYVNTRKVGISTDVTGIVDQVNVRDNQHVQAGQVLFSLRPQPFQIALERTDAEIGMVRDQVQALQASYRDMQAQIRQAQADSAYYDTEATRQQNLLNAHVSSQANFDLAQRNQQTAHQKIDSLREQQAAISAQLDDHPDGPPESNPRYHEAVAARDEAARELNDAVVRAPFSGLVTGVDSIAPGKSLPVETTAFYLIDTDHIWVDANPKETELTWVRQGQPARVHVDTYPNVTWKGVVESISPAVAQEFSLLPAENTSGNWVKVVQRVPLRIRIDTEPGQPPLRAGMSVEVKVDTGHRRGLPRFLTDLFGGSSRAGR